jgi:hypothetical protein
VTTPPPGPFGPPPGWPGQPPSGEYGYPPPYPVSPPPPGYPGYPGYPGHPGYPDYPPSGYSHPGPGYPPPGYPGGTPWKPGIIPLRPLSLSDIFNGAVAYVRANPRATLGMTTGVVLITSALGLLIGHSAPPAAGDVGMLVGVLTGATAAVLATILLSGMLTVVVARAVQGIPITVGQAWQRVRDRLPALIALTLLEILAVVLLIAAVVATIAVVARTVDGAMAALVGFPLVLLLIAALAALFTLLSLAPMAIVLERASVAASVTRSVALARPQFWRIFGIRLLASIVAVVVAGAVSVPFDIVGQVVSVNGGPEAPSLLQMTVVTIGQAIGQIITTPFTAGVIVLLYVDARIRSEAFDFVLQSAPAHGIDPDTLWLSR